MTETGLDGLWRAACAALAQGAADPGSAWRNLALATTGADGGARVRTVVLRGFDAAARSLEIHTDARSGKMAELRACPLASLHGWDTAARVQLRARGGVRLHCQDDVSAAAWATLRAATRATYRVGLPPGAAIDGPVPPAPELDDNSAYAVFCVVRLDIDEIDMLELGQDGHRRARFTWAGGVRQATWLVP